MREYTTALMRLNPDEKGFMNASVSFMEKMLKMLYPSANKKKYYF